MNNTCDLKINIIAIKDRPVYYTITKDYKPVEVKNLNSSERELLLQTMKTANESIIKEIVDLHETRSNKASVECDADNSSTGEII